MAWDNSPDMLQRPSPRWVWWLHLPASFLERQGPPKKLLMVLCDYQCERKPCFQESSELCRLALDLSSLADVQWYSDEEIGPWATVLKAIRTCLAKQLDYVTARSCGLSELNMTIAECQGISAVGVGGNRVELQRAGNLALALSAGLERGSLDERLRELERDVKLAKVLLVKRGITSDDCSVPKAANDSSEGGSSSSSSGATSLNAKAKVKPKAASPGEWLPFLKHSDLPEPEPEAAVSRPKPSSAPQTEASVSLAAARDFAASRMRRGKHRQPSGASRPASKRPLSPPRPASTRPEKRSRPPKAKAMPRTPEAKAMPKSGSRPSQETIETAGECSAEQVNCWSSSDDEDSDDVELVEQLQQQAATSRVIEVNIDQVFFTQQQCSRVFRDGRRLEELVEDLRSGQADPLRDRFLILNVVKSVAHSKPGAAVYHTLDHRRLWCMKQAEVSRIRVRKFASNPILDQFMFKAAKSIGMRTQIRVG